MEKATGIGTVFLRADDPKSGPSRPRTVLFKELLDYFLKVGITGAKAPREPVSAALGNSFAVRDHVELASLARCTDSINV